MAIIYIPIECTDLILWVVTLVLTFSSGIKHRFFLVDTIISCWGSLMINDNYCCSDNVRVKRVSGFTFFHLHILMFLVRIVTFWCILWIFYHLPFYLKL